MTAAGQFERGTDGRLVAVFVGDTTGVRPVPSDTPGAGTRFTPRDDDGRRRAGAGRLHGPALLEQVTAEARRHPALPARRAATTPPVAVIAG